MTNSALHRYGWWLAAAGALAGGGSVLIAAAPAQPAPAVPTYAPATRSVWLDQGWSEQQRNWYHHVSQGTDTLPIPYSWFIALERPVVSLTSPGLLSDPEYLDRFGFIPSPKTGENPDRLPVGFARTTAVDPNTGRPFDHVGFTCAACHTGRLSYRGTHIFIDGGPAMIDVGKFRKSVAVALALTAGSTPRFVRFAKRVLGPRFNVARAARLKVEVIGTVKAGLGMELAHGGDKGSLTEGFGRLDALNRIGNEVFSDQMKIRRNYVSLTAPVAYPHIWSTMWFDWVQYNSSIEQPMVRNAGEAMGVRALVNYGGGVTPRFTSTVPVDRLYRIEELLGGTTQPTAGRRFTGLRAPAWPENILPPIDRALADRGARLYEQHCSGCHLPAPNTEAFWTSRAWLPANAAGVRFLRPGVSFVSKIGTDEAQAVDMKNRTVAVPLALKLEGAISTTGTMGIYGYGPALGQVVEKVVYRWYDSQTPPVPPAQRQRMNGFRPNGIRDSLPGPNGPEPVYKARPLDGVWATAPFLHNGSVPTLYHLLSPFAERPRDFWLGNREFDPVNVGYVTGPVAGGFRLVAVDRRSGRQIRGNGNGGHLFETPADPANPLPGTIGPTLTVPQRMALIEFLKTL